MPARRAILALLAVLPALAAVDGRARAEVKEHEIRRLLMLKSGCQVSGVEGGPQADGTDRFLAACVNASHYPDGVEVTCPGGGDDRDCTIHTRERAFPHLRALER